MDNNKEHKSLIIEGENPLIIENTITISDGEVFSNTNNIDTDDSMKQEHAMKEEYTTQVHDIQEL